MHRVKAGRFHGIRFDLAEGKVIEARGVLPMSKPVFFSMIVSIVLGPVWVFKPLGLPGFFWLLYLIWLAIVGLVFGVYSFVSVWPRLTIKEGELVYRGLLRTHRIRLEDIAAVRHRVEWWRTPGVVRRFEHVVVTPKPNTGKREFSFKPASFELEGFEEIREVLGFEYVPR